MESKEYLRAISQHFLCSMQLAEILVKSAEVNGTKKELDRIAYLKEKELNENAN